MNPISRFIKEINEEYLETQELESNSTVGKFFAKSKIDESVEYICGEKVMHDDFGEGVIVSVDKSILTVAFPHPHGIKKLMKGHKSIRKV